MSLKQDNLRETGQRKREKQVKWHSPKLYFELEESKRSDIPARINNESMRKQYGKTKRVLYLSTIYANGKKVGTVKFYYDGKSKYGPYYLESTIIASISKYNKPMITRSIHYEDFGEAIDKFRPFVNGAKSYVDTRYKIGKAKRLA